MPLKQKKSDTEHHIITPTPQGAFDHKQLLRITLSSLTHKRNQDRHGNRAEKPTAHTPAYGVQKELHHIIARPS